jgi:hypothetical protein
VNGVEKNMEMISTSRVGDWAGQLAKPMNCSRRRARWAGRLPALLSALLLAMGSAVASDADGVLYSNDLEKYESGLLPDEFPILSGDFQIKQEEGNKFIELPGAPLESFWLMFGPAAHTNVVASVRIRGTSRGRQMPAFAVGVGGLGGYRLQVAPAKRAIEIHKGDSIVATAPHRWKSGEWLQLKLRVTASEGGGWKVEGKVWPAGAEEPAQWAVEFVDEETPIPGRPTITGTPYSGTPIQFDDLRIETVGVKRGAGS